MKFIYGLLLFCVTSWRPVVSTMTYVNVTSIQWKGVAAYLVVDKGAIQVELDNYEKVIGDAFRDRPLYLSGDIPVFSNVNSSQHVVYFNFGNLTASEFDGITPHPEVTVHIPFLASYPGFGPPSYSLAVAKFYQRSDDENDNEIPRVNIAYPYYPADKISISEKEALIQIGEEELRISFRKSDPCEKPEVVVKHQYDEFRLGELRTGAELPDFSYCGEHHGHNSRFCAVGNDLGDDLEEWKYRICQRWASRDHTSCIASLKIEKMTPMFRDLLSVGVSELRIVSSEQYHGNYTVEMFYPC